MCANIAIILTCQCHRRVISSGNRRRRHPTVIHPPLPSSLVPFHPRPDYPLRIGCYCIEAGLGSERKSSDPHDSAAEETQIKHRWLFGD